MTPLKTVGLDRKPAIPGALGANVQASPSRAAFPGVMTLATVLAEVCPGEYRYCGQFVNVAPPAPNSLVASTPAIPADTKTRQWRIGPPMALSLPFAQAVPVSLPFAHEPSQRKMRAKSRCAG